MSWSLSPQHLENCLYTSNGWWVLASSRITSMICNNCSVKVWPLVDTEFSCSASRARLRAPSILVMHCMSTRSSCCLFDLSFRQYVKSFSSTTINCLPVTRLRIMASRSSMTLRPLHSPITDAMRYTSSQSTSESFLVSRLFTMSSVASPNKPLMRYTIRMASVSLWSASQMRLYTSLTAKSRLMILLLTNNSMPVSSSNKATRSQSVVVLWFCANSKKTTSNKQPATSNKQPATSNQQQATSNKQQATSNQQQATSNKQQASSNQQQATSNIR